MTVADIFPRAAPLQVTLWLFLLAIFVVWGSHRRPLWLTLGVSAILVALALGSCFPSI